MPVRIETQSPTAKGHGRLVRALHHVFEDTPDEWFVSLFEPQNSSDLHVRVEGPRSFKWSRVFHAPAERDPEYVASVVHDALASVHISLRKLQMEGFGPFASTTFQLEALTILVGANGSGKTSLFEMLRAIRDFSRNEIPPEIIPGWETREVYHRPGPDRLGWRGFFEGPDNEYAFGVDIVGSVGNPFVATEIIQVKSAGADVTLLERGGEFGVINDRDTREPARIRQLRGNQLAFKSHVNPNYPALYRLKEQIESWRFFSGIRFNDRQLRQPALIEESPTLRDDGGNLASVLNWMRVETPSLFSELELHIRGIIPGFRGLGIRPSGAGRVTLTWDEAGLLNPLTAADLSDGSLRLLLWLSLALIPNPPALVCIDEPEVGLHPRTLPTLAGLLKKLSDRTQVIVATHSSYLLAQFDVSDVAILRKREGTIEFTRPATSAALVENLREFGAEELELMHRSDELEALS